MQFCNSFRKFHQIFENSLAPDDPLRRRCEKVPPLPTVAPSTIRKILDKLLISMTMLIFFVGMQEALNGSNGYFSV